MCCHKDDFHFNISFTPWLEIGIMHKMANKNMLRVSIHTYLYTRFFYKENTFSPEAQFSYLFTNLRLRFS